MPRMEIDVIFLSDIFLFMTIVAKILKHEKEKVKRAHLHHKLPLYFEMVV